MEQKDKQKESLNDGVLFAGRYRLMGVIGDGSSSVVHKAYDEIMRREIALKLLKENTLSSDENRNFLKQFQKETRAASCLRHENIAHILAFGQDKNTKYIAMELVNGQTLQAFLSRHESLNKDQFRGLFLPVLSALAYSHKQGILHRDIKPANIMFSENFSSVKVLDFGLAKTLDFDNKTQTSSPSVDITGTPNYMSPEQCSRKKLDQRSDIYSLACVMYESITGAPPFRGKTSAETMYKHLHEDALPIDSLSRSREIPHALAAVIMRALAKDADKRPDKMKTFMDLIEEALDSTRYLQKKNKSGKALKLLLASGAAVSLVAAACFIFQFKESKRKQAELISHSLSNRRHFKPNLYSDTTKEAQSLLNEQKNEKTQKAIKLLQDLLKNYEKSANEESRHLHWMLAQAYSSLNQFAESEAHYRLAIKDLRDTRDFTHALLVSELACVLRQEKKYREATELFETSIAEARKKQDPATPGLPLADYYYYFGAYNSDCRNLQAARQNLKESLALFDKSELKRTSSNAVAASVLFYGLLSKTQELKLAESELSKTESDLYASKFLSADYFRALSMLADAYAAFGKKKQSLELFEFIFRQEAFSDDQYVPDEFRKRWQKRYAEIKNQPNP